MSDVASRARHIAARLLPEAPTRTPPHRADIDAALAELVELTPIDAHDEAALHEASQTLMRLREATEA